MKNPNIKESLLVAQIIMVMAKPTNADLYGGPRIASQFSGTILIWRPFLKFNDPYFNKTTQIILESFRNAPAGISFEAMFLGEIPTFRLFDTTNTEFSEETEGGNYE